MGKIPLRWNTVAAVFTAEKIPIFVTPNLVLLSFQISEMRTLSQAMRAKAVGLLEAGRSLSKVAEAEGATKSGVSRIKKRLREKGEEVTIMGDFGKGKKEAIIKPRTAAWLKEASKAAPFKSSAQLKRQAGPDSPLAKVSTRRIRENLQRQGLNGRKAAKKPLLTPRMVEARLA